MKKNQQIVKYVLFGLSLLTMSAIPFFAVAQDPGVTVPNVTNTSTTWNTNNAAGVVIDVTGDNVGSVNYNDGTAQTKNFTTGAGIFDLSGVNVPSTSSSYNVAGVAIQMASAYSLSDKTINTGDITLAGDAVTLMGFGYDVTGKAFDGTLNIGEVFVNNTNNTSSHAAWGVFLSSIEGKVTVGNILATGYDTYGFRSADSSGNGGLLNGAKVELLGNVTAGTVDSAWAYGVYVDKIDDSALTVGGKITATGNKAYGFRTNNTSGSGLLSGAVVELKGDITATGANTADGEGYGLLIAQIDDSALTVGGKITATGYDAVGFRSATGLLSDAVVELKGDITATADNTGGKGYGLSIAKIDASKLTVRGNILASGNDTYGFRSNDTDSGLFNNADVKLLGNVTAGTVDSTWAYGVYAKEINGSTLTVGGTITAKGTNAYGFRSDFDNGGLLNNAKVELLGDVTAGTADSTWAYGVSIHKIDDGSTLTVEGNILATGYNAYGFYSANNGDGLFNNADVKLLGDVTVTAGSGYARGLNITKIDGSKLTVEGNINATGNNNTIGFYSGDISNNANVKLGDVTATGDNEAHGVRVGQIDSSTKLTLGTVYAESNQKAYGIAVGKNQEILTSSTLTITNDVVAKTNAAANTPDAESIGILYLENNLSLDLTLDTTNGDVQISGIATNSGNTAKSIFMKGANSDDSLLITGKNDHNNKNQQFIVDGAEHVQWETNAHYVTGSLFATDAATDHLVKTGKTVVIDGHVQIESEAGYTVGSADNNNSAGTLVVQKLTTEDGRVIVNNGLLAIDASTGSKISGTLTIGNDTPAANAPARVALYGNTPAGTIALQLKGEPTSYNNAVIDPITNEKVLSFSTITEYKLNAANTAYVAHNRKRASLADGFLLPASIHYRFTAWDAVHDHLISNKQHTTISSEFRGQAPCDDVTCDSCGPCDPCDLFGFKGQGLSVERNVWVNYIGRSNNYRSSYANIGIANGDWKIGTDGVQVGLDLFKTSKTQLGLLFGYEGSKATLRSDRLDADDIYFGAYAACVFRNGVDFRAVYNYGSQDYKLTRLDPGLGLDWYIHNSAFDGNTHELNLEFGKRVFVNANRQWSCRPVIGFDLLVNKWDAALEDGNLSTAIAYDNADYTQAFLRVGSDLKFVKNRFVFNSGLYYSYDLNNNNGLKTKVFARNDSKLGYDKGIGSTLYGSKLGRSVLTFNVGGSIALNSRTSIFGGFNGENTFDREGKKFQSNGYVGLQYQW